MSDGKWGHGQGPGTRQVELDSGDLEVNWYHTFFLVIFIIFNVLKNI